MTYVLLSLLIPIIKPDRIDMSIPGDNKTLTIIGLCFLTGTLDAIAALLISYKISPVIIFQYIASGWFGQAAFKGGTTMVIWGILFHYLIASVYSIIFFNLYPAFIKVLKNKYLAGLLFGLLIWLVMNFAVLPLTNIPKRPAHPNLLSMTEGIAALIICLGIPIAVTAEKYYRKQFLKKTLDV